MGYGVSSGFFQLRSIQFGFVVQLPRAQGFGRVHKIQQPAWEVSGFLNGETIGGKFLSPVPESRNESYSLIESLTPCRRALSWASLSISSMRGAPEKTGISISSGSSRTSSSMLPAKAQFGTSRKQTLMPVEQAARTTSPSLECGSDSSIVRAGPRFAVITAGSTAMMNRTAALGCP